MKSIVNLNYLNQIKCDVTNLFEKKITNYLYVPEIIPYGEEGEVLKLELVNSFAFRFIS